MIKKKN